MANLLKINIKSFKAYLGHDDRTMYDYNGIKNGKKRLPQNIDKELSKKNYSFTSKELKDDKGNITTPFYDFVNNVIGDNNKIKKMRDDQICLGSWVIQIPDEPKLNEQEQKRFFSSCFHFVESRYKSLCKGFVHYDEPNAKPHIHLLVLPFEDKQNMNNLKLNAKKVFNKSDLATFHKDLSAFLTKSLQKPINMLNDKTIKINGKGLNVKDLKDKKIIVNEYRQLKKTTELQKQVLTNAFDEIKKEQPKVYDYLEKKIDLHINKLNEKPSFINKVKSFFNKLFHKNSISNEKNEIELE